MNSNSSQSPEAPNLGHNWRLLVPRDLKIRRILKKNNGHLFYANASFVYHFVAMCKFKLILTFCMDITFVNGNNSWKFHDDMFNRRTETSKCVLRAARSLLKLLQKKCKNWSIGYTMYLLSVVFLCNILPNASGISGPQYYYTLGMHQLTVHYRTANGIVSPLKGTLVQNQPDRWTTDMLRENFSFNYSYLRIYLLEISI